MNRAKTPVPWKEQGTGTRYGEHPHVHCIASVAVALWLHSVWLQSLGVGVFSCSCIEGFHRKTANSGHWLLLEEGAGRHGGRYMSIC